MSQAALHFDSLLSTAVAAHSVTEDETRESLQRSLASTVCAAATARACSQRAVQHARAAMAVLPGAANDNASLFQGTARGSVGLEETSALLLDVAAADCPEAHDRAAQRVSHLLGEDANVYRELFEVMRDRTVELEALKVLSVDDEGQREEAEPTAYEHMASAVRLSQLPPRLSMPAPAEMVETPACGPDGEYITRRGDSDWVAPSDAPTEPPLLGEQGAAGLPSDASDLRRSRPHMW